MSLLSRFAVCILSPNGFFSLCFSYTLLYWSLAFCFCWSVLALVKLLISLSAVVNCAIFLSSYKPMTFLILVLVALLSLPYKNHTLSLMLLHHVGWSCSCQYNKIIK